MAEVQQQQDGCWPVVLVEPAASAVPRLLGLMQVWAQALAHMGADRSN